MAFIEASYRVPSPSGVVMLPETSTQNSMFVSTRRVFGALSCCGPARSTITTARIRAGSDSASFRTPAQTRPGRLAAVVERQRDPPARSPPDPAQEQERNDQEEQHERIGEAHRARSRPGERAGVARRRPRSDSPSRRVGRQILVRAQERRRRRPARSRRRACAAIPRACGAAARPRGGFASRRSPRPGWPARARAASASSRSGAARARRAGPGSSVPATAASTSGLSRSARVTGRLASASASILLAAAEQQDRRQPRAPERTDERQEQAIAPERRRRLECQRMGLDLAGRQHGIDLDRDRRQVARRPMPSLRRS